MSSQFGTGKEQKVELFNNRSDGEISLSAHQVGRVRSSMPSTLEADRPFSRSGNLTKYSSSRLLNASLIVKGARYHTIEMILWSMILTLLCFSINEATSYCSHKLSSNILLSSNQKCVRFIEYILNVNVCLQVPLTCDLSVLRGYDRLFALLLCLQMKAEQSARLSAYVCPHYVLIVERMCASCTLYMHLEPRIE